MQHLLKVRPMKILQLVRIIARVLLLLAGGGAAVVGVAQLAPLGLSFDAWLLFPQLPELLDLALAFPQTAVIINHCGGVARIGAYEGRHAEVFERWKTSMQALARLPNVYVKLGGLGMRINGFGFEKADRPAASEQLAAAWRPWMETCIEAFGADRCMFESNFPVDKVSYSYGVVFNAFKRLSKGYSASERAALAMRADSAESSSSTMAMGVRCSVSGMAVPAVYTATVKV